jgi:hypothetical protein
MRQRWFFLLIAIGLLFLSRASSVRAEANSPATVVNHSTKECSTICGGDECHTCYPPTGWEFAESCPADYTEVSISVTVVGRRTKSCCGQGSGIGGDCKDVVANHNARECAFVENIDRCQYLPLGWEKLGGSCWYITWRDDITCVTEGELKRQQQAAFYKELKDKSVLAAFFALGITLMFGVYYYARKAKAKNPNSDTGAKTE